MKWFKERKRATILETPFPNLWREILQKRVVHYNFLDVTERSLLENLTHIFIAEKNFEGCGGLDISDDIKVVVAAQASLLVLGLPSFQYERVDSVLVYPTTVTVPANRSSVFSNSFAIVPDNKRILGMAWQQGSVVLVWDAVKFGALHPEGGHNVVYHEFAHILDMRDGAADGTPELYNRELYHQWVDIFTKEFYRLKQESEKGKSTLLDSYGAVSEAEFFAVATELFFDRPMAMDKIYPELYRVLALYYQQDTAARERRYLLSKSA